MLREFEAEAPFTLQRLCEVLLEPSKQYTRLEKLVRDCWPSFSSPRVPAGRARTEEALQRAMQRAGAQPCVCPIPSLCRAVCSSIFVAVRTAMAVLCVGNYNLTAGEVSQLLLVHLVRNCRRPRRLQLGQGS